MTRLFITCFLVTFLAFPAFLAAQEQPLDAQTQKLWDAHTVVPKTDDIQKLRDFLQYGSDNWMQMNGRIHDEQTWDRFHIAKNKATFEAAERILELAKREPGKEPSLPKNKEEYHGLNDDDVVRYALRKKIGAFFGARDWDPDWEQHFRDFIEDMKKDPANKYVIQFAETSWFAQHFNAAVFPKRGTEEYPFEECLRLYNENFENLKRFYTENADDPCLKYRIEYWQMCQMQAARILEERNDELKKGTLVKPALEFYRSLYEKHPDAFQAEGWLKNINNDLVKYDILAAEDQFAAFQTKVEELKKSLDENLDENSIQKVSGFLQIGEDMDRRNDALRLLLTTVRPLFAASENEKIKDFVIGFDIQLKHLALEGQEFEFEAVLMDTTKIDIKDYRGKVVILDYWATWCGPCVGEFPMLKTFYENWHKDGVELIGFSVDEDMDDLKAFLEKEKPAWPIASYALSKEKKLADSVEKYEINAFPTTILIDTNGKVVRAGNGLYSVIQHVRKILPQEKE